MGFPATSDVPWTIPPEWSGGVQELLGWSSDVMRSSGTAVSQHRALRVVPRRSFTFDVAADGQDRRSADMLLAGHSGIWQLPIWPDVQWLSATLTAGATQIPCTTAGYDFVAGGKALLLTAVNTWEIVGVATIAGGHIGLSAPTVGSYGIGDRLYPLRAAQVQQGAEESLYCDSVSSRKLTFDIKEPCEWPILVSPTTYLTHPVLDVRPDETVRPASAYTRLLQTVDYGTSFPVEHDLPGVALRAQNNHWNLYGRAQHSWFRSLMYTLDGRRVPVWVPSFARDLHPAATIAGNSKNVSVEWCGYTMFGFNKANRKDLRIELDDGTVLYRRITAAVDAGATETLTLDTALAGTSIIPGAIRAISFMALCTSASDQVEIDHLTDADGLATATTGWQAVVPDV